MKISKNDEEIEIRYSSWVSTLIDLIDPTNVCIVGGRGVAKTTDILAKRSIRVVDDLPGGTFSVTSDTYVNAFSNVIPNLMDGWKRHKFFEGIHYVCDEQPPAGFTKNGIRLLDWKRTISTYNGCLFLIRSLDRSGANAGISVIHQFGDEAKLQHEVKLKKATPTLRGNAILYERSHYFMGRTFTTDMPNPADGEDDWILRTKAQMDVNRIYYILQAALNVNDEHWKLYKAYKSKASENEILNIQANIDRWEDLLRRSRKGATFFYAVSSLANLDVLTFQYILNNMATLDYAEFKRVICSIEVNVERGKMFYANLNDKHFYLDGYNYDYYDQFGIKDNITMNSRGLTHIDGDVELDAGMDCGNMMSLVVGQEIGNVNRVLKNMHVLSPQWIRDLADKFVAYFEPHRYKKLNLYYDRAANNYKGQGQDLASEMKHNVEYDRHGRHTGWKVNLMSIGQGNISHGEEYDLCSVMMSGNNRRLPQLLIDRFECKELKSSLELAEAKTVVSRDGKKRIQKVKTSEKKRLDELPMKSTNYSDAFKYYICRRKYLNILKNKSQESFD